MVFVVLFYSELTYKVCCTILYGEGIISTVSDRGAKLGINKSLCQILPKKRGGQLTLYIYCISVNYKKIGGQF